MQLSSVDFVLLDSSTRRVTEAHGSSIMQAAVNNGIQGIQGDCGGSCACATCHIYVAPPWLDRISPASQMENDLLEGVAAERRLGSRLACQLIITEQLDGITVEIPECQS